MLKLLLWVALTAYLLWAARRWVADWKRGHISRFPRKDVDRAKEPARFRRWTIIHGAFFTIAAILNGWGWVALANGTLR